MLLPLYSWYEYLTLSKTIKVGVFRFQAIAIIAFTSFATLNSFRDYTYILSACTASSSNKLQAVAVGDQRRKRLVMPASHKKTRPFQIKRQKQQNQNSKASRNAHHLKKTPLAAANSCYQQYGGNHEKNPCLRLYTFRTLLGK